MVYLSLSFFLFSEHLCGGLSCDGAVVLCISHVVVKALGREIKLDRVNVLFLQVGVGLQELDAQPRACKGLS